MGFKPKNAELGHDVKQMNLFYYKLVKMMILYSERLGSRLSTVTNGSKEQSIADGMERVK